MVRMTLLALTLLALTACTPQTESGPLAAADPETRRESRSGPVIGFTNGAGGHSWLGIPFAAPPVGELRWRAPRPPEGWSAPREALRPGNPCIQFGSPLGGIGAPGSRQGDEDCLYLNVYAPRLERDALATTRLPVMLWIHGGGNTVGHAAFYNGQVLAERERVIVVMINYRLGPFGWFVPPENPELKEMTTDPDLSGNYGNLDVIAALQWVRANAAAFGGDPQNVTVFGESAGATNALALLVSPPAQGLFHRVILQSTGFGFARTPTAESNASPQNLLRSLLVASGRAVDRGAADRVAAQMSASEQASFLRSLDPWTIYAAYRRGDAEFDRVPTVFQDGQVIRRGDIHELLGDPARHFDVPVIVGTNRDEPKIFMAFDRRHVRTAAGLPYALREPDAYEREARYRSLLWKADSVDSIAERLALYGAPVWAYRWDWDEQGKAFGLIDLSRIVGAAHGLEIPFVLGYFEVGPQSSLLFHADNAAARLELSEKMMAYWANFARDGKPGRGRADDGIEWQPWSTDTERPRMIVFDTPADGGIRMAPSNVSRDSVLALIERETAAPLARCAAFRATFRNRDDAWADAAWQRVSAASQCSGERLGR